jgi:hypothetical protein
MSGNLSAGFAVSNPDIFERLCLLALTTSTVVGWRVSESDLIDALDLVSQDYPEVFKSHLPLVGTLHPDTYILDSHLAPVKSVVFGVRVSKVSMVNAYILTAESYPDALISHLRAAR